MGALPNAKHERFAQEVAAGNSATEAYRLATGKNNRRYASELGQKPDIAGRISELIDEKTGQAAEATAKAMEALQIDRQWVMERLVQNAEIALGNRSVKMKVFVKSIGDVCEIEVTDRDSTGANRALELLGKEFGMFVDRSEVNNFNYVISPEPLTEEEWERRYGEETSH